MDTKGNGLDRTNEILTQILGELGAVKQELGDLNRRTGRVESEIVNLRSDVRQLNTHIELIAGFVGQEIKDIKRRLDVLEGKAA